MAGIQRVATPGFVYKDPITSSGYDNKNHKGDSVDNEENPIVFQEIPSNLKDEDGYESILGTSTISGEDTQDINSGPHTFSEVQDVVNLEDDPMRRIALINQGQEKAKKELSSDPSWVTSIPLSAGAGFYFGGPLGAVTAPIALYAFKWFRAQQSAQQEIIDIAAPKIIEQLKELAMQLECNGIIPVTKLQADVNLANLSIQGKCTEATIKAHKLYTELLEKQSLRIT